MSIDSEESVCAARAFAHASEILRVGGHARTHGRTAAGTPRTAAHTQARTYRANEARSGVLGLDLFDGDLERVLDLLRHGLTGGGGAGGWARASPGNLGPCKK